MHDYLILVVYINVKSGSISSELKLYRKIRAVMDVAEIDDVDKLYDVLNYNKIVIDNVVLQVCLYAIIEVNIWLIEHNYGATNITNRYDENAVVKEVKPIFKSPLSWIIKLTFEEE